MAKAWFLSAPNHNQTHTAVPAISIPVPAPLLSTVCSGTVPEHFWVLCAHSWWQTPAWTQFLGTGHLMCLHRITMTIFPLSNCASFSLTQAKFVPCYLAVTVPQVLQVFPVGMSTVMSFMLLMPWDRGNSGNKRDGWVTACVTQPALGVRRWHWSGSECVLTTGMSCRKGACARRERMWNEMRNWADPQAAHILRKGNLRESRDSGFGWTGESDGTYKPQ